MAAHATTMVKDLDGRDAGMVELAPAVFGIEPNTGVMHQVVTAQLAAARAGTHSTRTRGETAGGGSKPWRQKGTGRARHGSIRAPQWRGGGVAHGPEPRSYRERTPKKMVQLALRSALSDRAADGKVAVVDAWSFDRPRTRVAKEALKALAISERARVLVVLGRQDETARRSFRNLEGEQRVRCILADDLNAYEVLVADYLLFSRETLEVVTERLTRRLPSKERGSVVSNERVTHEEEAGPGAVSSVPSAGGAGGGDAE